MHYIKTHIIGITLHAIITVACIALYANAETAAIAERGHAAIGGEDLIIPAIYAGIKYLVYRINGGR